VFVFKMPVARVGDLVAAAIEVAAPLNGREPASIQTRSIDPRPGEKPYEELMTEEESTRARDIGEMFAVLPAIEAHEDVLEAYRQASPAPVGAYRSDRVDPLAPDEVTSMVADAFAAERRVGTMGDMGTEGPRATGAAAGGAVAG
jgi:FlaA1/EpsC-like NDP-sugar epimerase